jgi:WD40 repeat protein
MVKVWTPQKNAWQVLSLVGHTAGVVHVAWSPDETKVASASDDQTIRIWNVETAAIVHTLEGHRAVVRRVAWSPDGRTLLSGSDDGDARLWDAQTGRALHVLNGGGGAIYHVAFDPTGKQVAIAGVYTRAISFWDVATGKRVREIPQPGGVGVWAWAWSPDGRYIATGDDARLVRIWDAQTGKEVRPPSITGNTVISLAWSPDSRFIAAGSTDRSIYVWTAADGALQRKLKGHQGEPLGLAWNGKHPLLASAGSDGDVRFWDMAGMPADTGVPRPTPAPSVVSRAPEALPLEGERGRITRMRLSTGGQTLAVQSAAPGVGLHDPATGGLLRRVQETGPVSGFDLSPDGQTLFTASGPRLTAWKAGTGAALWTWEGKAEHPTELQVTPDGAQVAGVDEGNHHVLFWTAQTGQLLRTVAADGQVSSLAFSPDGQTLVYGNGLKSRMGFVTVRDAAGSKEPRLLDGYRDLVPGVALSPDGQWVAGASLDRTLKLWSWPSGKEAGTLSGHLGPVRQVAFFPNGKWLASAGDDGAVRLWDLAGSREIQAIGNPAERAGPFALSPDGRTLLVARENPDPNGAPTVEQWRAQ